MARPKVQNSSTIEYRKHIEKIFDITIDLVVKNKDLEKLDPRDRVRTLLTLIQYFIPKPTEAQENTEKARQDLSVILSQFVK